MAAAWSCVWLGPTLATAQPVPFVRPVPTSAPIPLVVQASPIAPAASTPVDPPVAASAPAAPVVPPRPEWQELGRSGDNRAIVSTSIGGGGPAVLVVGPLNGLDIGGMVFVDALANYCAAHREKFDGWRLVFVREPNPDGRLRRQRTNAAGVDLDRNFAAANWRRMTLGTTYISGRDPESEAETKALSDLIHRLRPERVLMIRTEAQLVGLTHVAAGDWQQGIAQQSGLPVATLNPAEVSGSLAAWVGDDLGRPVVIAALPVGMRIEESWQRFGPAIVQNLTTGAARIDGEPTLAEPDTGRNPARELPRDPRASYDSRPASPGSSSAGEVRPPLPGDDGRLLVPIGRHESSTSPGRPISPNVPASPGKPVPLPIRVLPKVPLPGLDTRPPGAVGPVDRAPTDGRAKLDGRAQIAAPRVSDWPTLAPRPSGTGLISTDASTEGKGWPMGYRPPQKPIPIVEPGPSR